MNPLKFIPPPVIAQTSEAVGGAMSAIDRVAAANDRWLFIGTLAILLGFATFVVKWLVKSLETKDALHAVERKELNDKFDAANLKFNEELKAERHASRDQRNQDQLAFLNSLEKISSEVSALTASQRASTLLLEQHVREVSEHYRQNISQIVESELIRLKIVDVPPKQAA